MDYKVYTILWLDDQHEKMNGFKLQAKQNGINLIPFKSLIGLDELEKNYQIYDGVLLDAKFFEHENDTSGTENINALSMAKDRLLQLPKRFTPFVLTGQAKLFNDDTFNTFFPHNYRKGNEDDVNQLFADIKRAADNLVDTQVKHNHTGLFEIFTNGYLPREVAGQVLELIKSPPPKSKAEKIGMLTNIRNIHESCFVALKKIEVIPISTESVNSTIWFLSGSPTKDSQGRLNPTTPVYQNRAIENLHKWLYFTCGNYIHYLDDKNYNDYMISNYAMDSLRNGLLELLLWFKQIYKENSQKRS